MKRGIFLAILPMLAWLSIAVVQVLIDPYVRQDETYVDRQYRDSAHANADDSWSYAENTTPYYMERQGTGDPIRNLDGYGNQGVRESNGRGNGSNNNFHNVYSH